MLAFLVMVFAHILNHRRSVKQVKKDGGTASDFWAKTPLYAAW